jgi:cytochrome c-type biogenesis protein CcsB
MPYDKTNFNLFITYINAFQFMANLEPPLILPPNGAREWRRMGDALLDAPRPNGVAIDNAVRDWAQLAGALAANQPENFNAALRDLRSQLVPTQSAAMAKARAEVFFNQMEPFYNAMVIYLLAGLLAVFSWFNLSETLRRSAMWLVCLAFVIHTVGLVYRMVLEGRPPVTNLYSSAIFIGWGACLLGIILERFHKNGIGLVVASGIGFITLIIAHHLALEGDTMEMMRAVLDTNFWLATHVVAVTVGYASTFVAGFLGLLYVLLGVFTTNLTRKMSKTEASIAGTAAALLVKTRSNDSLLATSLETTKQVSAAAEKGELGKSIARMIYGIVCFATLFSFVGTVLGGIWADQSWGRFWGWDPKENGALIIVLWNALILHLRWGGLIRERGLVNCAIFGNVVTAWSWFGVNMLGIGLHSYGFTEAAFKWLVLFVASQLAFIALGMLPVKWWRSFKARTA